VQEKNPTYRSLSYKEAEKAEYPNTFIFKNTGVNYFGAAKRIQRKIFNGLLIATFK